MGLLQPVADGVKLLLKQIFYISNRQRYLFIIRPALLLGFFILVWVWLLPWDGRLVTYKYTRLIFFSLLGVGAYAVIITGWSSSRRYSKLGRLRGILQSLSFEVALILVYLCILLLFNSFQLIRGILLVEVSFLWGGLWLLLSLIERNRAPFDLLEGERELIRGFNIEMGRLTFVYLFLREYGMLIILTLIIGAALVSTIRWLGIALTMFLLFVRRCFPRVRYDVIIRIIWQAVLPLGMLYFILLSLIW